MAVEVIFTIASRAFRICGSGTSTTSTWFLLIQQLALMMFSSPWNRSGVSLDTRPARGNGPFARPFRQAQGRPSPRWGGVPHPSPESSGGGRLASTIGGLGGSLGRIIVFKSRLGDDDLSGLEHLLQAAQVSAYLLPRLL